MNEEFDQLKIEKISTWKQLYAKTLVEELNPSGNVLEIGFLPRATSEYIQKFSLTSHVIIEAGAKKVQEALDFSRSQSLSMSKDVWSQALNSQGVFDLILYHEQIEEADSEIEKYLFAVETKNAANEINDVLKRMEEQLSKIDIHYSDEAIEAFVQRTGQFHLKMLPAFFQKLLQNKNITHEQFEAIFKKYQLNHIDVSHIPLMPTDKKDDECFKCLDVCLANHLKPGGRFSFFVYNGMSLYENAEFFDKVITNPDLDYQEKKIQIDIEGRTYDAIIPIITKL